jgi:hypothetical protein
MDGVHSGVDKVGTGVGECFAGARWHELPSGNHHMHSSALRTWILPAVIVCLALADGLIHLELDRLIFGGNIFSGRLSELFTLNFIGYLVLAGLLVVAPRLLGPRQWIADALLGVYVVATIGAWFGFGSQNPMGIGVLDKSLEIVLLVVIAFHLALQLKDASNHAPDTQAHTAHRPDAPV